MPLYQYPSAGEVNAEISYDYYSQFLTDQQYSD